MNEERLYEEQVEFLEKLIEYYPYYLRIFNPDERKVFCKYFMPVRKYIDNLLEYRRELIARFPGIEKESNKLLKKFINTNKINISEELL